MKTHQLRYLTEIAAQGLNFSNAAAALHTSQEGISQQIRLLEEELGVDLFIRDGVLLGGIGVGGYDGGRLNAALARIGPEVLMRQRLLCT